MKEEIKSYFRNEVVWNLLKIYILILFFFLLLLAWKWRMLPPEIPLFYSLPRSQEQLGSRFSLIFLPVLSLVIFAVNLILTVIFFAKERLGGVILMIITDIISFLLLVTYIKIIFLVT